jgi:hypothetical protein
MGTSPTPGLTPAIIAVFSICFPNYPVPDAIAYCMALDWLLDRYGGLGRFLIGGRGQRHF